MSKASSISSSQSQRREVHQLRAAGVGDVGDVQAAVGPPVRFQISQVSIVPNSASPASRARARAGHVVEQPSELQPAEIGGERQARSWRGSGPGRRRAHSSATSVRGARVLPDQRVVERLAAAAVPEHRRLALIGDADGGEIARRASAARAERVARSPPACCARSRSRRARPSPGCG